MQRCPYLSEMKERLLRQATDSTASNPEEPLVTSVLGASLDNDPPYADDDIMDKELNPGGYGSHTSPAHHRVALVRHGVFDGHNFPKNAKTSLFIIMSFIYAKLLVVICIAYVLSEVVTHNVPLHYYEGFFTYLYGASILFLLYVFCYLLHDSSGGAPPPPPKPKPQKISKAQKKAQQKAEKEAAKKQKKSKKDASKEPPQPPPLPQEGEPGAAGPGAGEKGSSGKGGGKSGAMFQEAYPRKMKDVLRERQRVAAEKQAEAERMSLFPAEKKNGKDVNLNDGGGGGGQVNVDSPPTEKLTGLVAMEAGNLELPRKSKTSENDRSHGSFFLRVGAIAFGLGTMIYNGLEFGAFFELPVESPCYQILRGVNPVLQMVFTFMQMYFIFMNSRLNIHKFKVVARFGLMHVVATNLCVWIRTLVLESLKEITTYQIKHGDGYSEDFMILEGMRLLALRMGAGSSEPTTTQPPAEGPWTQSPPAGAAPGIAMALTDQRNQTDAIGRNVGNNISSWYHHFPAYPDLHSQTSTTLPPTTTTTDSPTTTTATVDPFDFFRNESPVFNASSAILNASTFSPPTTTTTTPYPTTTTTHSPSSTILPAVPSLAAVAAEILPFSTSASSSSSSVMPGTTGPAGMLYEANVEGNYSCGRVNIMGTIVQDSAPYLFPFIIEYSLIGAAVVYVMWSHIGWSPRYVLEEEEEEEAALMERRIALGVLAAQGRTGGRVVTRHGGMMPGSRVDCVGASKGLFFGLLLLVASLICLILFFVLIRHPDLGLLAIYLADVSHCGVMALSILAILIGFIRVQSLKFHSGVDEGSQGTLNDILLRVSAFGLFVYAVFSIIAGSLAAYTHEPNLLVMITGILSVVQVVLQLLFIADVGRRRVHLPEHDRSKPGRQVVTFLLICNVTMWVIYTFETQKVEANPVQLDFYGFLAWAIVQRVTLPLCIFHRFHSAVTFAEIWKTSYKAHLD
ncbi:proton channel OtopLc-like isoform X2 [Hetaerina americana]|uniref:proton channel OtopLc-like isoform X2 n=1 Tax=Hetaerina americana TaxID=62018 RepID=UPI003A7F32AF